MIAIMLTQRVNKEAKFRLSLSQVCQLPVSAILKSNMRITHRFYTSSIDDLSSTHKTDAKQSYD